MFNLGAPELLIVLFIALLLFGSTRLPKLARSMGDALRELRGATAQAEREDRSPREA